MYIFRNLGNGQESRFHTFGTSHQKHTSHEQCARLPLSQFWLASCGGYISP